MCCAVSLSSVPENLTSRRDLGPVGTSKGITFADVGGQWFCVVPAALPDATALEVAWRGSGGQYLLLPTVLPVSGGYMHICAPLCCVLYGKLA
jgi:hypothetical protein